MIDPRLYMPRVEAYGIDILDADEVTLGTVRNRLSASVEQNVDATIRGGMSISMMDSDIDWPSVRFRPWVRVNELAWTLGVYLPAFPSDKHRPAGVEYSSPCLDKLSILNEFAYSSSKGVAAGSVVTDVVSDIIETDIGESATMITDSPLTTSTALVWGPGTSGLRVINDLLRSINYTAVWCDRAGRYRVEPYTLPADRPVTAEFLQGQTSIHSPSWTKTINAAAPNRVILTTQGDGDTAALTAVAENNDPDDPYSIPSRGRVVAKPYENVDAADQATLDALAVRYLSGLHPVSYLEVSHAVVPVELNDIVRFKSGDTDVLAAVNEYRLDLKVGALVNAKWVLL